MKYSPSTGGFYTKRVHGATVPADAVEVSTETYVIMMKKQAEGARIVADAAGFPLAAEQKMRPVLTPGEIEALRLIAYADPLTGSDRYLSESNREALLGNAETAEVAKLRGLTRFAEIQAKYPWPDDFVAS